MAQSANKYLERCIRVNQLAPPHAGLQFTFVIILPHSPFPSLDTCPVTSVDISSTPN